MRKVMWLSGLGHLRHLLCFPWHKGFKDCPCPLASQSGAVLLLDARGATVEPVLSENLLFANTTLIKRVKGLR